MFVFLLVPNVLANRCYDRFFHIVKLLIGPKKVDTKRRPRWDIETKVVQS